MVNRRALLLLLPASLLGAYTIKDERGTEDDDSGSPTGPTAPAAPPDKIEFRVLGSIPQNIPAVTIRHFDPLNGLTQVTGNVPYVASLESDRATLFVSLEASAIGTINGLAWLHAQIIVNGVLFREAIYSGFDPRVSVSGTIRRGQSAEASS